MSDLPATHQRQIDEGRIRSLILAGIGKTYHDRRLSQLPGTEAMVSWLRGNPREDIREGKGWTVIGSGARAYDATMLLALAMHMKGITSLVVPMSRLALAVQHENQLFDTASDVKVLLVTNFYQIYPGGRDPMNGWQLQAIETFLTSRMEDKLPTCLHLAATTGTWWSDAFLQRVADFNYSATVH